MSLQLINKGVVDMPFKMNFGCGNTIKSGMVNIDAHVSDTIKESVQGANDIGWLYEGIWTDPHEFPVGQFSLIEAFDVLEHFHPDMIGNILYCFRCSMSKGGELRIKVPDFEIMAKKIIDYSEKELTLEWLNMFKRIELIWMAPYLHEGIGHQSIWTKSIAKHRLENEGFQVKNIWTKDLTLFIDAKRL